MVPKKVKKKNNENNNCVLCFFFFCLCHLLNYSNNIELIFSFFFSRFIYGSVIIILLSVLTRFWIQVVQKLRDPPIKTSRGLISLSDDDTVLFPAITICYYAQYTYE